MTQRMTDIERNIWIFRNPSRPSETLEVRAYSVPINHDGFARWEDVVKVANA